jgi:hypothetical protein
MIEMVQRRFAFPFESLKIIGHYSVFAYFHSQLIVNELERVLVNKELFFELNDSFHQKGKQLLDKGCSCKLIYGFLSKNRP